jgi:ADP-heptose:LPS heptosyltransferase
MGLQRHNSLQSISGVAYGGERMPIATDMGALQKFGLEEQRYLTIHNGFGTHMRHRVNQNGKATKCYPHYDAVVAGMRKRFPGLHFVQLGSSTSTPIAGVDCSLIGRTTLPEAAEILRHSVLHIDNESGLVHLAAALGVKSCVLFGPTDAEFFSYQDNINLKSSFCGGCWWITSDWLSQCPRGFAEPRCLSELQPETVVEAVTHYMSTVWKVKVYEGAGEYPEAPSTPHTHTTLKSAG